MAFPIDPPSGIAAAKAALRASDEEAAARRAEAVQQQGVARAARKYQRAAQVAADAAVAMYRRLGPDWTSERAVPVITAVMPALMDEILHDPGVIELEGPDA